MYKFYYTNGYGVTSYIRKSMACLWQTTWNPIIRKWLMRMNLTCLILLIAFLQVSLANAQKISLSKKNATLTEVFKELKKQTGYGFMINREQIKMAKPVTINVTGDNLEKVLDKCFEEQPFTYKLEGKLIVVIDKKPEQVKVTLEQIDVKGRLVDENGNAMMGASVFIKGTKRRTITTDNGEFSFTNVDESAILVITFVGYETKEVSVKSDLEPVKMTINTGKLEEVSVVSTGYQILPKERATGSFTVVGHQTLNEQVSTDIIGRLEGVASTITRDRSTNGGGLMVRGLSTIRGMREPLIILDNFPYEGKLENINPNDIEDVTILKDAAAASIWGARAGNGVIVLRSKKAKIGQQIKFNVMANTTMAEKPDLYYQQQIGATDFLSVEQFLFGRGYYTSQENSTARPALTPAVELMIAARQNLITAAELAAGLQTLGTHDLRRQLNEYTYGHGLKQQYYFDVKGGEQKSAWNIGAGYDRNKDELAAQYQRLNVKADHLLKLGKLEFGNRLSFTQSQSQSGKTGIGELTSGVGRVPLYSQIADVNGNALALMRNYRTSYTDGLGDGQLLDWNYYPLTDYQHQTNTTKLNELLLNSNVGYQLLPNLKAMLRYQYQRQQVDNRMLYDVDSYYARNLINTYSTLEAGNMRRIVPLGGILNNSNEVLNGHQLRGQLDYGLRFNDHNLDVLLGSEVRNNVTTSNAQTFYGYNDNLLNFVNVDYANTYPTLVNGSRSFLPNNNGFSGSTNRFVSLFGNMAYSYKARYTLSASARRDASNMYGVEANRKWNPFWSVGGAWTVSSEPFYKLGLVDYLKLRATYGYSGNTDPRIAAVTTLSYMGASPFTLLPTAGFSNYANPDLSWERVGTLNLGIDFKSSFGLQGSVEYYLKKADDLFGLEEKDYTTGVGFTILKNAANMKSKGVDIELRAPMQLGKLKWTPSAFFNYYRDEVTAYYLSNKNGSGFVNGNLTVSGLVGKPVYSMLSYRFAGLDPANGDPMGYLNGQASKVYGSLTGSATTFNDLAYHGPLYAPYSGAFANNFEYGGFSLAFRVNFRFGNYFRKETINYTALYANRNGHADFEKRWQQAGDELKTTIPSMVYPAVSARDNFYTRSEATIQKGDLVRLQYVNLNYTLQRRQWKQMPFERIQFFAVGSDLGLLYTANREGLDPVYPNAIRPPRMISLGLNTTF